MKKKIIIGSSIAIGVVILALIFWPRGSSFDYFEANPLTLKRTITVSGSVKSPEEIDLAFKTSGRIEEIGVKAGDRIKAGDFLVKLETREAENAIAKARASVYEAQARLNQLKAGVTEEERSFLQSKVDSASRNLGDIKQTTTYQVRTAERAIESAQTSYDNAVQDYQEGQTLSGQMAIQTLSGGVLTAKSAIASVESLLEQTDLILGITGRYKTYNDKYKNLVSALDPSYKSLAKSLFYDVQSDVDGIVAYESDNLEYINASKPLLSKASLLADNMINVLNKTVPSIDLSQETINGWQNNIITNKTNIISGRNSVESVLQQIQNVASSGGTTVTGLTSSLSQFENAVNSTKNNLDKAKTDLALVRSQANAQITQSENALALAQREMENKAAPPREVDLQIYRASVSQANSRLNETIILRDDLILTVPLDGVVGKINFEKGETVNMGQTVVAIISGEPNEVEVNFPETDIVYIQEGKPLSFTFDGFSDEYVYEGNVASIEPAHTEIQGVIYYKSDISFDPNHFENVQPRSGMTVNIDVIADQKDVAVALPYSAVKEDNFGNRQVALVSNDKPRLAEVTTGYEGDDNIEIISGLTAGETVLLDVQQFEE